MKKILSSKILSKALWFSTPNTRFDIDDFQTPSRKIALQKFSKKNDIPSTSGLLNSTKCDKTIQYESQLEFNFFVLLEYAKKIQFYGCQPLKIEYKYDDYLHYYYPDFYYLLNDGSCVIGEIKTIQQMGYYKNWMKWKALKNYCKKSGLGLLITDGKTSISDLGKKKVNQYFKKELFAKFNECPSIEWEMVYELKEKYGIPMRELASIVYQEKIQWHRRPSRFLKDR